MMIARRRGHDHRRGTFIPIRPAQVAAARSLHRRMRMWEATDKALLKAARAFPDHGLASALAKASMLNQLYFTNVFAVTRMAEHVVKVLKHPPPADALVDAIARVPRAYTFRSFASKYAHFFVDPSRYPILDRFAVRMVAEHLGRPAAQTYRGFRKDFFDLLSLSRLRCSSRDLDRYLWLGGLYKAWRNNPKAPINGEARRLFQEGSRSRPVATLLRRMSG